MATHDVLLVLLDSDADKVSYDRVAVPKSVAPGGIPPLTFGIPLREHPSFPNPRAVFQQVWTDAQAAARTQLLASLQIPEGPKTTVFDTFPAANPLSVVSPAWRFYDPP